MGDVSAAKRIRKARMLSTWAWRYVSVGVERWDHTLRVRERMGRVHRRRLAGTHDWATATARDGGPF